MTLDKKLEESNLQKWQYCNEWHRHHIDPTLQKNDVERYNEFRSEDIMMVTPAQHRRLHRIYNSCCVDEYMEELRLISQFNREMYASFWDSTSLSSNSQKSHK